MGMIKLDRDEVRARQRYQRLSKVELVDRLLTAERNSAESKYRWLRTKTISSIGDCAQLLESRTPESITCRRM